jgi:hypothetical protein
VTAAETARVLGAALALKLPVFPCILVGKDKPPTCPRGFYAATTDPAGMRELWRHWPGPLVGVPTGEASALDVLDVDAPRHYEAAEWYAARRDRLPATRVHWTRSGGLHVLFRHRLGMRCWTGRPVPGIDGRGNGGYIVWWPAAGLSVECDAEAAPWPDWLIEELAPPKPPPRLSAPLGLDPIRGSAYWAAALRAASRRIATAPAGARNDTLNAEAYSIWRLVAAGALDGQEVADTLAAAAIAAGVSAREIEATLRSAIAARGLA